MSPTPYFILFFFFNDTATTEIYTLSLHDALPISFRGNVRRWPTNIFPRLGRRKSRRVLRWGRWRFQRRGRRFWRSEEHTSELESRLHLVCRLLLEKKKK